ncbi:mechanosensitive ion channel [Gammaproteobacteria bacterium]|nr:mechanosensitive ion channel [Gammaproteobacteria bacterium]|tara:strand:- start:2436 stop:3761 length:1326 start_codon:yes stop_codon:yes gene_type:complete
MVIESIRKIPSFLNFIVSESIVLFVIFLNACVFLILDVNPQIGIDYPLLYQLDIVCILFFIIEAFLKIYSHGYKNYFSDNWNKFDSLIVLSSIPILLEPIMPSLAANLTWAPILRMTRVLRLAKFLRLGRIIRYAGRDGALSQIRIPIYLILLIVTSNFLLGLFTLPDHIQEFIKIIYAPSLILSATSIVSKISLIVQEIYLNPIITRDYGESAEVIIGFGRTGFVLILWFVAIIVSIEVAGFNSFSLIAGLGIGSLAIAFAAQDALGNILAGISLLVQKHFAVGDYLKIGENEGRVVNLGLRSFILEARDGSRVSIPNKSINVHPLHNLSARKKINDNIYLQLSSSLTSQELESSIAIIKSTCSKFDLISGYRVKIVEMKFTHNINITFSTIIDDVKEQIKDIDILDIAPTVGSKLYMEIFSQLEKSELTPDTKILFMQN